MQGTSAAAWPLLLQTAAPMPAAGARHQGSAAVKRASNEARPHMWCSIAVAFFPVAGL